MNLDFLPKKEIPNEYIHPAIKNKCWDLVTTTVEKNGVQLDLLTFPLVSKKFCDDIIDAAEKNNKWTDSRHENYPTFDMELKTFGWYTLYSRIFEDYIHPLVKTNWQLSKGASNYSNESFIAKYDTKNQDYLAVHYDQASYSCLLALNDDFEGGGTFYPRQNVEINLEPGYALVHPELNYRHGGRAITQGIRYIIVSFINNQKKVYTDKRNNL